MNDLEHRDTLCLMPEIPVAGRLTHFARFWEDVFQADLWVLEIVNQGYSIELFHTPQFRGVRNTQSNPAGPDMLTAEVKDLLRKRAVAPVPLDQDREGFFSMYFLVPKRDGGHRLS